MSYNNAIPAATDQLSVSQGQILANFAEIATAFNLNHVAFNAVGEGKHAFVEMPAAVPTIATIAGEIGLYSNTYAVTAQPELYFQRQTLAANSGLPVSAQGNAVIAGNTINYTYLLSGVLVCYGKATTSAGGTLVMIITNGGTTPTYVGNILAVYAVPTIAVANPKNVCMQAGPQSISPGNTIVVNSYNGSTGAGVAVEFYWYAIGI